MCGIVGIASHRPVNQELFDALTIIQHRGQDAAGIMTSDQGRVHLRKGNGLVRDVIRQPHIETLAGNMGIGHVRYPTAGTDDMSEAQPLYVNSPYGLSIVHNGNLVNAEALKHNILEQDLRHLNTHSDSEVLLNVFAHELQQQGKVIFNVNDVFKAVTQVHTRCEGAYAVVIMIAGQGLLAIRDPLGIRPLVYGQRSYEGHTDYMIASESVALDALGFKRIADIEPGEAVFISNDGTLTRRQCSPQASYSPCIFEYIYLARPDSILDGVSVHKVRLSLGEHLANKIVALKPDHDVDVVIPIPDTSRIAALSLAQTLGVNYREGFVKNRYVGRTFIMPGQQLRKKSVRQKLNAIGAEFKGKNVLLVDDSIVRGTTSREIIRMAREAGAKKVYFASSSPQVRFPNVYGIDMPSAEDLIAHNRTDETIANQIGADWLVYQDIEALREAVQRENPKLIAFEESIFTGHYRAGTVDKAYLNKLADNGRRR